MAQPNSAPSGKGQPDAQPVLIPYPGYNAVYTVSNGPSGQPSRRKPFRRLCHFSTLLIVAAMLWTVFFGHGKSFRAIWDYTTGRQSELIDDHEPCYTNASWKRLNPDSRELIISSASFDLPVDSDLLYLISRGALSFGSVHIEHHPSDTRGWNDEVRVEVEAHTWREESLDHADVCLLHPGEGSYGLGIFTPRYWHPRGRHPEIVFYVKLYLPRSDDGSPTQIKHLDADVPLFTISSDDLVSSVFFSKLTLKSSNAPVKLGGITAETAVVHTSNAPIEGVYNTTKTLELLTSNGPIYVTANLFNNPDDDDFTHATLKTSNAPVNSNVNLISTASNGQGGLYLVNATTSNSPLKLASPTFAVDGSLHLSASSSNSPVHVLLNEAFEGTFDLHTGKWFKSSFKILPELDGHDRLQDPKGEGRTRQAFAVGQKNGGTQGWAAWALEPTRNPPPGSGEVYLSTSNSNVELIV